MVLANGTTPIGPHIGDGIWWDCQGDEGALIIHKLSELKDAYQLDRMITSAEEAYRRRGQKSAQIFTEPTHDEGKFLSVMCGTHHGNIIVGMGTTPIKSLDAAIENADQNCQELAKLAK